MDGIQWFWTATLIFAVVSFLAVEVIVVVGGASDLADMVRSLLERQDEVRREGERPGEGPVIR